MPTHLRISQAQEKQAVTASKDWCQYRCGYSRSAESRSQNDSGQDYLALCETRQRIAFVVCDGVGQSFYGDVAARFLGDALLDRLFCLDLANLPAEQLAEEVRQSLTPFLADLVAQGQQMVSQVQIPPDLPGMVQQVLEKKRALGSESTFLGGILDHEADRFAIVWMGDTRLRVWRRTVEHSGIVANAFLTQERWSTRLGPVGNLHVFAGRLLEIDHLLAYSDGFEHASQALTGRSKGLIASDQAINLLIEEANHQPTSDDIAIFEWWVGERKASAPPECPHTLEIIQPDGGDGSAACGIRWTACRRASRYQVALFNPENEKIDLGFSRENAFTLRKVLVLPGFDRIGVRAWRQDEPGMWKIEPFQTF